MGDYADNSLRFERSLIMDKEIWRLFTGHFIHGGWTHLWLNIAGLIIIWFLNERYMCIANWWTATLVSSFLLSIFLLLLIPQLEWYIGLSGLLHAMFSASAYAGIRKGFKEAYILFALLIFKIVWEQTEGSISSTILDNNIVIIDAHMYGMVCGIISIYLILIWRKFKKI